MSTAVVAVSGFFSYLHIVMRWLSSRFSSARSSSQRGLYAKAVPPGLMRCNAGPSKTIAKEECPSFRANRLPLRIVRVVEAGQAPTLVGRMTISGSMADVCAELDRLVALETTAN